MIRSTYYWHWIVTGSRGKTILGCGHRQVSHVPGDGLILVHIGAQLTGIGELCI